jgi:prepilin-type N-terminal cleavage/methylation domain-containing protein
MIQRSLEKKRSGQGGFTLIELLIVIVILAILAAIVVLAIGGLKQSSKKAACDAEAKTLETAEDAYYASTGNSTNYASGHTLFTTGLLKTDPDVDGRWTVTGGAGTYEIKGVANQCAPTDIVYNAP